MSRRVLRLRSAALMRFSAIRADLPGPHRKRRSPISSHVAGTSDGFPPPTTQAICGHFIRLRVLLQGSVVEGGGLPTKGRLRSSVQLHQRASVRYVACLIHV